MTVTRKPQAVVSLLGIPLILLMWVSAPSFGAPRGAQSPSQAVRIAAQKTLAERALLVAVNSTSTFWSGVYVHRSLRTHVFGNTSRQLIAEDYYRPNSLMITSPRGGNTTKLSCPSRSDLLAVGATAFLGPLRALLSSSTVDVHDSVYRIRSLSITYTSPENSNACAPAVRVRVVANVTVFLHQGFISQLMIKRTSPIPTQSKFQYLETPLNSVTILLAPVPTSA